MAGNFNKLAAGRKVYSHGSHAPTKGTVKPGGYVKREVKKQSKKRSGLAKKALRRKKAAQHKLHKVIRRDPKKKPAPIRKPAPKPRTNTSGVTPATPVGSVTPPRTPAPAAAPANPYVTINSNGQLDLPYNDNYSWDVLDSSQQMNQSLLQLQQQRQQQQSDYVSQGRNLDQQYDQTKRTNLNTAAARGVAQSSTYGNMVAQGATAYNNQRTDLDTQESQNQQNYVGSQGQITTAFNDMLRQSALQNAQTQAANAGKLGYGQASPTAAKPPAYKPPVRKPVKVVVKHPVRKPVKKNHPVRRKKAALHKLRPIR